MNQKTLIIGLGIVILMIIGIGDYVIFYQKPPFVNKRNIIEISADSNTTDSALESMSLNYNTERQTETFSTQQECEQTTGQQCGFKTCDFIPKGKTFEEVCGKNFQKGWTPIN